MKKLLTCFFAMMICAPAVFAADGAIGRAIPSGNSDTDTTSKHITTSRVATRSVPNVTVSGSETDKSVDASVRSRNAIGRVVPTGADSVKTGTSGTVRSGVASRSLSNNSSRSALDAAVNTVGRNERVSAASINSNPAVRRAGLVLRPSTAEVGGRAVIGDSGVQTGSNIDDAVRRVKSRASVQATAESIALATERLEKTAALNKSCQEQYNECMDQFCAVIDANQKRCSCSANLTRYTKVESAVKDANTQLNDVAQRIRYVGLSADEIRAIMTETEAESALSGATDTSETRGMLEDIEDLIRNPTSSSVYSSSSSSNFGLDMDLDFSSDTGEMFSLDFLNTDDSSFSNLRGTALYNAAKKRCSTVLNQCKDAGATATQITGNYELAIDKDCIAYEQGLTKMNETLLKNVRSANQMLQKARLTVLQNKNEYDARGCIAALDTCMTDDMVCGSDYYKCIDPTKKYIDENGNVILGQNVSKITDFMSKYDNSQINKDFLKTAYSGSNNAEDGSAVVRYLLQKIGTKQKVTDEGLCRAVLDKCQAYTYSDGNYKPYNDVVVNYVQRAMVNIRAAQQNIISEYASTCMSEIATCYNQQMSQVNSWSTSASVSSIYKVMTGACRNVALTCAYAVFDKDDTSCPETDDKTCIQNISEMFYQSMLCPDNSTLQANEADSSDIGNNAAYVNQRCKCNDGYVAFGSACLPQCPAGKIYDVSGNCVEGSMTLPLCVYSGGKVVVKTENGVSKEICECGPSFIEKDGVCGFNIMTLGRSCPPTASNRTNCPEAQLVNAWVFVQNHPGVVKLPSFWIKEYYIDQSRVNMGSCRYRYYYDESKTPKYLNSFNIDDDTKAKITAGGTENMGVFCDWL